MKKRLLASALAFCIVLTLLPINTKAFDMGASGHYMTINAGETMSAAILDNGSLYTWGYNGYGALGDDSKHNQLNPVKIMDGVCSVNFGTCSTFAIKNDKSLWSWGSNDFGKLGGGITIPEQHTPVKVMEDIVAVSPGYSHTLAIKSDGTLWAWGFNGSGAIGNGSEDATYHYSPVKVMDDVIAVSAGSSYSMAIKRDHTLWAWGSNSNGQFGNGTSGNISPVPIKVAEDVIAVSCGSANQYTMIIRTDGSLWAAGTNDWGELGIGNNSRSDTFVKVMDDVKSVSPGGGFVLAIKNDGSLWGWGLNNYGQLGDGADPSIYNTPHMIMNNVVTASAGSSHSIIEKDDGSVWTFGKNNYGQLGNGTLEDSNLPICIFGNISGDISGSFENGTLTISGTGPMEDYDISPWNNYRSDIRTVIIEAGITRVGNNAISNFAHIKSIYFRGNPPEFGTAAFAGLLAVAVYPSDNELWTPNILQNYGGSIIWQPEIPAGPRIARSDTWHFENLTTEIPRSLYDEFLGFNYGIAESAVLWAFREWQLNHYYNDGTAGNCFGMNVGAVTSYFNKPPASSYGSWYSTLYDVFPEDKSSLTELTARQLIQYGQILQTTYAISFERAQVSNNLQALHDAVLNYVNGNGLPIDIGIDKENAGHELLALSLVDLPNYSIIGVYDSNFPNVIRPLYLHKSNGRFTSWEYQFSYEDKWGSSEKKANISMCKLDDKLYRTLVEKEMIDPEHPTLLLTDSKIFNVASNDESVAATAYESSNPELVTPVIYNAANVSNGDSAKSEKYLYWVDMGDKFQFANVDAGAEVWVAAGENGISVKSTVAALTTMTVSADYASKDVLIENTSEGIDDMVTIKYYGNSGNDELETIVIEAITDSAIKSTNVERQTDISGIKSLAIRTAKDVINLSDLDEDCLYQIEIDGQEKIVSIRVDTDGDNIYDDVVYPRDPLNNCVVTFNAVGGTVNPSTMTTDANGKLSNLPVPIREGYIFDGWYTLTDGGDLITEGYVFTSDTIIYAHWTKDKMPPAPDKSDTPSTPSYPGDWGGYYDGSFSGSSYQITVPTVSNGTVTVTPKSAKSGDKVTITVTPNEGFATGSFTVMDRNGKNISVTDNGDGTYTFIMPASQVTVSVTFAAIETPSSAPNVPAETPWINPFTDVYASDWFYTSVQYVYENGLMTGDGNMTIFNPYSTMTRAMVWTVLGRMDGAYVNGTGNEWYAKAQAWAVTNNVSDGTNPNSSISRQELMTMLWRYIGSPAATADLSQFSDYADVADWANVAMQWAASTGLIVGDNGCLNPVGDARRSEVATIFMRFCEHIVA